MPERVATADSDFDSEGNLRSLMSRALGRYPRDMIAIFVATIAAGTILVNALYRQPGPHPAPIFAIKPRPVAAEPADVVPVMPRARPEVIVNQKAAEAPQPRPQPVKMDAIPVPAAKPAAKADPIAALINPAAAPAAAPTSKVMQVQRALNDFGYGPVKASGSVGPDTTAAIQKFERERKLPVTGQISPRVLKELATVTGRPLD